MLTSILVLVIQMCPTLYDPLDYSPLSPWNSPGKNTGVGYHVLLQRIFPTQGLNLHLLRLLHWQGGLFTTEPSGKPLPAWVLQFTNLFLHI